MAEEQLRVTRMDTEGPVRENRHREHQIELSLYCGGARYQPLGGYIQRDCLLHMAAIRQADKLLKQHHSGCELLSYQVPVFQMLSVNNTPESMNEDMVIVAVVISPLQLVEVSVKMLHADLVEGSYDATLEQGPDTLNTVGVNVSDSPLLNGVVDCLMAGVVYPQSPGKKQAHRCRWLRPRHGQSG